MKDIIFASSDYAGANQLYFTASLDSNGLWVNGTALEAYNAAHWPLYAIALTLNIDGNYYGDFPAVPDGVYAVKIWERLTGTAAPTDNELAEGDYEQQAVPVVFNDQMQLDGWGFISDFAEPLTYTSIDNNNNVIWTGTINGVVNRNPPALIQEDGKVLADDLEINIANDVNLGRTSINPGRDTISVSGRYGGTAKSHLVTMVISGDAGIWTLRCK